MKGFMVMVVTFQLARFLAASPPASNYQIEVPGGGENQALRHTQNTPSVPEGQPPSRNLLAIPLLPPALLVPDDRLVPPEEDPTRHTLQATASVFNDDQPQGSSPDSDVQDQISLDAALPSTDSHSRLHATRQAAFEDSQVDDWVNMGLSLLGSLVGRNSCLSRAACLLSQLLPEVQGKEFIFMALEGLAPNEWKEVFEAIKTATVRGKCGKYLCFEL